MRKSSKLQSILYLLLVIVLLAVAVGGVSNLRNSIDEAFNNGGGSSSNTTQATDNSTANVPVTTAPTTGSLHTHVYSNNGFCSCGVACDHLGYRTNAYIPVNDGKNHIHKYKCDLCKVYYYTVGTKSCEDNNNDRKCDLCGGSISIADTHVHSYSNVTGYCSCGVECSHYSKSTRYSYASAFENKHYVVETCDICDMSLSGATALASCVDSNNDGLCDDCKHEIEVEEEHVCSYGSDGYCSCGEQCSHSTTREEYSTQGSDHTVDTICSTCGYLVNVSSGIPCTGEDCFICEQLNN
ncbi:MAG: hypothetical protein E7587_02590 [Ruminococcaceae bacterium]|nr:hypothetical protein [Oscillospiraceae bacterium]